jgi:DNA-binding response OmpR family regulator
MPRVLVVDDELEFRSILREFLAFKGYDVLTAADGPEALQVVKEERPHVVLLDICMPKMNGLEVLRQIRAIDREVRVIMVTEVQETETGRAALKLGACDLLAKPVDLRYLERCLWRLTTEMIL